jgi:Domain of unknown function (DUF4287)/Domain of unknown function (DUF5655)
VPTVEEGIQAQIRNIEKTYGRTIDDLVAVVAQSGLAKHNEVVAMLKEKHGLAHGAAHRVSLIARSRADQPGAEPSPRLARAVEGVYTSLLERAVALGGDVEQAPKKGYVSLRRRKQFAMLQPGARWVNVGLVLPGVAAAGRLESATKWNSLFTHRVRVATVAEIDKQVVGWLRTAYEAAG